MRELLMRLLGYFVEPSPELVAATVILGATVVTMALTHGAAKAVRALFHGLRRRGFSTRLSTPVLARAESRTIAPLPPRVDPALLWRELDGANATVHASERRAGVHTSSAGRLIDAAAFTYDRLRQDVSTIMPVPQQRPAIALVKTPAPEREVAALRTPRAQKVEAA